MSTEGNMFSLRISQAGNCPRRIQLEAWGVEGLPPWEGSERAFAEGRLHEADILAWATENLPGAPYIVECQQQEVTLEGGLLVGHIDGILRPADEYAPSYLIEVKCLAHRGFQELREKGVREAYPQYYTQVQLYLAAVAPNTAYLVARDKETPKTRLWDHYFERIEFDPDFVGAELARLSKLAEAIESHRDIEPPYTPSTSWRCRPPWCPYTYHCHPDYRKAKADVTDRSDLITTVETLQELNEEIKALEQSREEIKAKLLSEINGSPVRAGRWLVQVVERRREAFDTKLARQELPADVLAKLLKITTYRQLEVKEV